MNENEREALYGLISLGCLGPVTLRRLYEHYGDFGSVFRAGAGELQSLGILTEDCVSHVIQARKDRDFSRRKYASLLESGANVVTFLDEAYPKRLLPLSDYPLMLFYKGRLPDDGCPGVAIVGARACSRYGEEITAEFARALASAGVQIVSGLALGADAAAHAGALRAEKGRTFGVMGCGIDICYPERNYYLYEEMQKEGGVLTEFPAGAKALKRNFPMRNRLISGLTDAVLVTEAREKSGSLITASRALDQGKEVFAVPGRVTDALSRGCNLLIAEGARPALDPDDILEYLQLRRQKKLLLPKKNIDRLAKNQKMLYDVLDFTPRHLDEIANLCGLDLKECLGVLLQLELDGYITRTSGQYYCRKL